MDTRHSRWGEKTQDNPIGQSEEKELKRQDGNKHQTGFYSLESLERKNKTDESLFHLLLWLINNRLALLLRESVVKVADGSVYRKKTSFYQKSKKFFLENLSLLLCDR